MIYQGWEPTPWYLRLLGYAKRRKKIIDPDARYLSNRSYWTYKD